MKKMVKTYIWILAGLLASCAPLATQQMDIYGTAVVAQQQVHVSGLMLTGTAQAPIVHITETSAAFAMEQARAAATDAAAIKTATAAIEQTKASWTPTPVPTSTPNATSTIVAAQVIAVQTKISNETKRQEISNTFWAVILPMFLLSILLVLAFVGISYSRQTRRKVHKSDVPGDKPMIEDTVTGEIIDQDANPNYSTGKIKSLFEQMFEQWLEKEFGFRPQLPAVTAERQDAVKEKDQVIDLRSRTPRIPKRLMDSQGTKFLPEPSAQEAPVSAELDTFPLPEWDTLMAYQFQAGGEFPFGSFAEELARINVNEHPHIGLIGPTGCGKSRLFLRPFTASALASGNRVIILGDMVDFVVFKIHPNATLVPVYQITKPEDAAQYVHALSVINSEMERRFKQLADQNLSTWERSGGENTLIVLDELGPNLDILDDTNPQTARALRGFLSILISKGRKAGFNFVFASTRAVGLKKQLSQVSTIAFRLKDTDEERYAFGQSGFGAERLPKNYFLSKIGSSVRMTGSFNPTDQQLADFLMRHTTKTLEKPMWIEGVFKNVDDKAQLETGNLAKVEKEASSIPNDDARILELHRQGKSATAIVWEIWKTNGGSNYRKRMEQVKSVTSTSTSEIPSNMALEA